MSISIEHKTRTTRPRTAGAAPRRVRIAEVSIDGAVVDTVVFGVALLRRLERDGVTPEAYAAQRAAGLLLSR